MKCFFPTFLVLIGVGAAAAEESPLKDARKLWLKGNYAEARSKYEKRAKEARFKAAAAVGISRTWQSEGEYDKALAVIEKALGELPKNPDLLARQAELLYLRGKWESAEKAADKAVSFKDDQFLARWVRGQIYRDRGDLKKANAEFKWFVQTYNKRDDIKDPEELDLIGQAATEYARYNHLSDQFKDILTDLYGGALEADKNYWWAEYHAGMLLLEKQNEADALKAFGKAETINAGAAEVLVGRGQAALQKLDMQVVENLARRALKINSRLPEARRLLADFYLAGGDMGAALKELDRARAVNPRDEETLGCLAACYLLQGKQAPFDALAKEVARFDPKPAVFYAGLAERLEGRRRFTEAKKYYKEAIAFRPRMAGPHAALGLLHMRMGLEKEARDLLEKAFKADDYNVRVYNTLQVLDHLDKYDKIETKHFLLRYDPKNDQVLARYMAKYLEEIYTEYARLFQYRPKDRILIELFNRHTMFSGRVIALPDLHTIGACTGRMFAMVSPRDQSGIITKPFNWARVLRHEMVHIFNLEQTNFLVPHWYTEGLAVLNEGFPPPPEWHRLLRKRFPDTLLNLDTIDMGFIRPRSGEDWNLAYYQSLLYVEYMRDKYGAKTVGEMLAAYREGLGTGAAIQKVCKVSKAEFEKGYKTFLEGLVRKLRGKAVATPLSLDELQEAHAKKPNDLDLTAQLADRLYEEGEKEKALKLAQEVLNKKKAHPLASYVRAKLYFDGGQKKQAMSLLEATLDQKDAEPKVLLLLGQKYFEAREFAKAAKVLERGRKADPYEVRWLVELAKVYGRSGKNTELIGVLKDLAPTDADSLVVRKKLADLLLKAKNYPEAERYARQALEINVLDRDSQRVLTEALRKQNKDDALKELQQIFGK
jgi:tetratricopeptide (TPR) repeat protein